MTDLAIIVMAFNEESILARCLESVKGLGELHVSIDQATTDKSEEVARGFGAAIYHHRGIPANPPEHDHPEAGKALNSYSRMRNEVIEQVCAKTKAPWLMWLDADEVFLEGGDALLSYCQQVPDEVAAIATRMNLYLPTGQLESVMRNSKVIRRAVRFTRRRHEHIDFQGIQTLCEEAAIGHFPTQPAEVRASHDERKVQLEPFIEDWREFHDGRAAFYIADWWFIHGHPESALRWFEAGLALPPEKCPPAQRAQLSVYAGKHYLQAEQFDEARHCYFLALEYDWHYGEACYYLGALAANQKKYDEARHWFNIALTYPPNPASIMQQEQGCTNDLPYYGLACCAAEEGKRAEAYRLLDQAERRMLWPREQYTDLRRKLDEA